MNKLYIFSIICMVMLITAYFVYNEFIKIEYIEVKSIPLCNNMPDLKVGAYFGDYTVEESNIPSKYSMFIKAAKHHMKSYGCDLSHFKVIMVYDNIKNISNEFALVFLPFPISFIESPIGTMAMIWTGSGKISPLTIEFGFNFSKILSSISPSEYLIYTQHIRLYQRDVTKAVNLSKKTS